MSVRELIGLAGQDKMNSLNPLSQALHGVSRNSGFLKAKPQERSKVFFTFWSYFYIVQKVYHIIRKALKLIGMLIILQQSLLFIQPTLVFFCKL